MNGVIKTLFKPDWDDNPKRSEILHAANLLQIGEFQLIQLAYKAWYRDCLLYTSPSPRDGLLSRMPSSA